MTLERTNLPENCLGVLVQFYGDEFGGCIYANEGTGTFSAEINSKFFNEFRCDADVFYVPFNENTPKDINLADRKSVEKYGYISDDVPDDIQINSILKEAML